MFQTTEQFIPKKKKMDSKIRGMLTNRTVHTKEQETWVTSFGICSKQSNIKRMLDCKVRVLFQKTEQFIPKNKNSGSYYLFYHRNL
mmetsp:Transcript_5858/g.14135  ORF Transcript_5858/g.14135 Transcript_5858/m.14135 type:complete len:86 (-) Transcript_5858:2418-2675(-)